MSEKRLQTLQSETCGHLETHLEQLEVVWEEIGITNEQRNIRVQVVVQHIRGLLQSMVGEEEALKEKLLKNSEKFGNELIKLCRELQLPPHEPPPGLTVLKLEQHLRQTVDKLNIERHERVKVLKALREQDQLLCDILHTTPYYIPSGTLPSQKKLDELRQHVEECQEEKDRRFKLFKSSKASIMQFLDDLERSPNTSFQKEVVLEDDDSFPLSTDNMKYLKRLHDELEEKQKWNFAQAAKLREQLESLWEKIDIPMEERQQFSSECTGFKPSVIEKLKEEISRCKILRLQNMSSVIAATRKELEEWWAKCYYSEDQKQRFRYFKSEDVTEECLQHHEDEVEKVKEYYRENKEMLENVARQQKLWHEFQEMERRPPQYDNRACAHLKAEKAKKKLEKELPRVEERVREQIAAWEKENGKAFLVGGQRFTEFIAKQREEHERDKENEKKQRNQKKEKELQEEMIYGSKPVTPGKRRFIGTPAKTPNKIRKLNGAAASCIHLHRKQAQKQIQLSSVSSWSSILTTVNSTSKQHHGTTSVSSQSKAQKQTLAQKCRRSLRRNSVGRSSFGHKSKRGRKSQHFKKADVPVTVLTPVLMPVINESKTPMSSSRMQRSNFHSVFSPAVPRSAGPKTPHRPRPVNGPTPRKGLVRDPAPTRTTEGTFSHTTVAGPVHVSPTPTTTSSSHTSQNDVSDVSSLASIANYQDFAKGLNRENCRSSIMPGKGPSFF